MVFRFFRTRLNAAKSKFELNSTTAAASVTALAAKRSLTRERALSGEQRCTLWLAACVRGAPPAACERDALCVIFKYGVLFVQSQSHAPCNGSQDRFSLSRSPI